MGTIFKIRKRKRKKKTEKIKNKTETENIKRKQKKERIKRKTKRKTRSNELIKTVVRTFAGSSCWARSEAQVGNERDACAGKSDLSTRRRRCIGKPPSPPPSHRRLHPNLQEKPLPCEPTGLPGPRSGAKGPDLDRSVTGGSSIQQRAHRRQRAAPPGEALHKTS